MQTSSSYHQSSPGPWGQLEYFYTFLDSPDSHFDKLLRQRTTQWVFPGDQASDVVPVFERLEVPLPDGEGKWVTMGGMTFVQPTCDYLNRLTPEETVRVQKEILSSAGNLSRLNEFVIERGDYRQFTEGLGIPDDLIEWTEARLFRTGEKTLFASTCHALERIADESLRLRYLKSLARCRALFARLRVRAGDDLVAISRWWSAGPNRTRSLPLLEAALATRGVDTVDLLHLLPPVPRRLLNTYALERDRLHQMSPDCYWAAMNFFEPTASSRYLDENIPRSYYFTDRFFEVEPPYEFGDVLLLVDLENDRFIHSYVYIADDIVYTKNGSGKFFPYVLMKQGDMMTRYLEKETYVTRAYRLHSLSTTA